MKRIQKVKITGFWGNKTVDLNFDKEINFLIGLNGSGKTTIINLIAASLKADFQTLDKFQFSKIKIDFFPNKPNEKTYIQIEKKSKSESPYPTILFKIKTPKNPKPQIFNLDELEEEHLYRRYSREFHYRKGLALGGRRFFNDINVALEGIVNLTWLSVHRTSIRNKGSEESFESTIDKKIKEIQSELEKYFGVLEKKYSLETEKFQKNIFLSLIEDQKNEDILNISELESTKEKKALKEIFEMFGLKETEFEEKLEKHFQGFEIAKSKFENEEKSKDIKLIDLAALIGTQRIHTIVQQWNSLNKKKKKINKPKTIFIEILNSLFQNKEIVISDRNELLVRTESGKEFQLPKLSSGEKQLLIILGQSLLQENQTHIYIADEPELSLHVEWQEKLVDSLRNINPNSQILFATHSPDIVGKYSESIIKVEKAVK